MTDHAPTLDRVHLVGIGGAGMSGIARILLARGAWVSGSDAKDGTALAALRALGARIAVGHSPENLDGARVVVASSAIRPGNPELVAARERGIPVLPRAQALAQLMVGRTGVAVAGTHGKTTTTSMLVVALQHCHTDPSFAIGADLNEAGSGAHEGTGPVFVAEADESDASFLLLRPHAAIVTSIEADHLDHYGSPDAVAEAFRGFARQLPPDGFLVACADDAGARALAAHAREQGVDVRTYGRAADADLQLRDVSVRPDGTSYVAHLRGTRLGVVDLAVVGVHNALDSAAAVLTGIGLGLPFAGLADGLAGFTGARRRMELKGTAGGVRVFDDYAHNPAKVAAALTAARVVAGSGRLVVVFQPHLYSRTAYFAAEFGQALGLADVVVVLEVYGAREDPVPGVSGALVAGAVPLAAEHVRFEPSMDRATEIVASLAAPGDLVMTVGAGDVTLAGPEILARLGERSA
ncbi:MAG TPA: UDP-N-acetylmuramate--L-alanine ligase [Mycobacteriales bacterium]